MEQMDKEHVILVDDDNMIIGQAPKLATHHAETPLHRGFSLFLFNSQGLLLLQQRAACKKTWPLIWSNSVCGHPMLGETTLAAARRRLLFELGMQAEELLVCVENFRYRAELHGIVENEWCPILVGRTGDVPIPNPEEVEAVRWTPWQDFFAEVKAHPDHYSPWSVQEVECLRHHVGFLKFAAGLKR